MMMLGSEEVISAGVFGWQIFSVLTGECLHTQNTTGNQSCYVTSTSYENKHFLVVYDGETLTIHSTKDWSSVGEVSCDLIGQCPTLEPEMEVTAIVQAHKQFACCTIAGAENKTILFVDIKRKVTTVRKQVGILFSQ